MFVLGVFTNKTKKSEIKQSDFTPNKTKKIRNEAKQFYALQPIMCKGYY